MDNETRLLVVDPETHESLRSLRLTATEEMAVLGTGPPSSSSPPASPSPPPSSVPSSPTKKRENGSVSKQPVALSGQVQKPTRRSPSKAAKKVSWPFTAARVITSITNLHDHHLYTYCEDTLTESQVTSIQSILVLCHAFVGLIWT